MTDYTIKLSGDVLNAIGNILAERPYKDVAPIIANLQQQAMAFERQEQAEAEAKKSAAAKERAELERDAAAWRTYLAQEDASAPVPMNAPSDSFVGETKGNGADHPAA